MRCGGNFSQTVAIAAKFIVQQSKKFKAQFR
jgi:hypothetical protein